MSEKEKAVVKSTGSMLQQLGYSPAMIDTIRKTVAKGASDHELIMFLSLAKKYDLDPFKKEIWCIKYAKKKQDGTYDYENTEATIFSGRDGFKSYADKREDYEGLHSDFVCDNDDFEVMRSFNIDDQEMKITGFKHNFKAKDRGPVIGAWAICYRTGRKPVFKYAMMSEYNKGGDIWGRFKSAMIIKCAESMALRGQYTLSGLTSADEVDPETIMDNRTEYDSARLEQDEKNLLTAGNMEELSVVASELGNFTMSSDDRNRLKKAYETRAKQLSRNPVSSGKEKPEKPESNKANNKSESLKSKPKNDNIDSELFKDQENKQSNKNENEKILHKMIKDLQSETGPGVTDDLEEQFGKTIEEFSDADTFKAIKTLKIIGSRVGMTGELWE